MKISEILKRLAALRKELQALIDKDVATFEDKDGERMDALEKEIPVLQRKLKSAKAERKRIEAEERSGGEGDEDKDVEEKDEDADKDEDKKDDEDKEDAEDKEKKSGRSVTLNGTQIDTRSKEPKKVYRKFGAQLRDIKTISNPALHQRDKEKAFNRLERIHEIQGLDSRIAQGNTKDEDASAYAVQLDISRQIKEMSFEASTLLSQTTHLPLSPGSRGLKFPFLKDKNRADGYRAGGVQVYRVPEGGTVEKSPNPKISWWKAELLKMMAVWDATQEVLDQDGVIEALIKKAIASEFAFKKDNEILRGNGTTEMKGILNAKNGSLITIAKEVSQAADSFVFENVVKMWARMYPAGKKNAAWYINPDVMAVLPFLKIVIGDSGHPIYLPPNGAQGSPLGTLYGRPIFETEHCSTLGDLGDILLMDMSQFAVIDKGEMREDSTIYVRFLYDEMTFRFIEENNGAPLWEDKMTPAHGNATLSPFIALAERA